MEEFPVKEVILAFGSEDLRKQLQYRNTFPEGVDELSMAPFTAEFTQKHHDRLPMLTHNATGFDPNIEALIAENQLMQAITVAGLRRTVTEESAQRYIELKRSHRLILASRIAMSSITHIQKPVPRNQSQRKTHSIL